MTAANHDRRDWLFFVKQDRCCYLGITPGCVERGGQMVLPVPGAEPADDWATRDHVKAKSKKPKFERAILLLACRACNVAKAARDPTADELERGLRYQLEWEAMERAKQRQAKANRQERREEERRQREVQREFHSTIEHGKKRRARRKRAVLWAR